MQKKRKLFLWVAMTALGILAGWFLSSIFYGSRNIPETVRALRLDGYRFISPLLVCDTDSDKSSSDLKVIQDKIEILVSENDKIVTASVYLRDINSGNSLNINPDASYAPASLSKIPVMIAYYKMAETKPDILKQKVSVVLDRDYNASQVIPPKDPVKLGGRYTIDELINRMIVYSDNNAYFFLVRQIDEAILVNIFKQLKIATPPSKYADPDFTSASDFSYFLRVLYNGTYLDRDYSEKALLLLGKVDYSNGLVAGVPKSVAVAHKFGHVTKGNTGEPEMHDCGIVYAKNPYVLCVMTKGKPEAKTEDLENVIKSVSELAFDDDFIQR